MNQQKRVKCPACQGVAFVKKNRVGDSFLTCPTCGAWNGRGAKYRSWCEALPELPEPGTVKQPSETPAAANDETVEKQDDWLTQWGNS